MRYTKMFFALALSLVGSLGVQKVVAQAPSDAYRNNVQELNGTARAQALSGAVGAVGADPTAVQINPAGIGLYLRSALSGTLVLSPSKSKSTWLASDGTPFGESIDWLGTGGHISYIAPLVNRSHSSVFHMNWGLNYNREHSYKREYGLISSAPEYGLSDYMAFHANLLGKPFKTQRISPLVDIAKSAAFIEGYTDAAGLVPEGNEMRYRSFFSATLAGTDPSEGKVHMFLPNASKLYVVENGYRDNFDITLGMGFSDRFYIGATLSFDSQYYHRSADYREDFMDHYNGGDYNSNLKYRTTLEVMGTSVGVDLGAMMALGDYGRIGISYRLPQTGVYRENYQAIAISHNDAFGAGKKYTSDNTDLLESSYNMLKPGQLTLSAMGFLGRYGFASYDFQYRNLGHSKLYNGYSLEPLSESEFIKEDYGAELTHRFGVELRPWHSFALRAGYSYTGNPMKAEQLKSEPKDGLTHNALPSGYITDFVLPRSYQTFTGGVGFNLTRSITLDLAYVHAVRSERAYPFSGDNGKIIVREDVVGGKYTPVYDDKELAVRGADLKTTNNRLVATLTFNF